MTRLADEWAAFLLAVQFMTRLPVRVAWSADRMAASPRWYAAAGVLIGLAAGGVYWIAAQVLPPVVAVLVSTGAILFLTGALHEDGFADCCDGLGGGADKDRALEIMRDSRIGSYGAVGLGVLLALKISTLAALPFAAVPAVLIAGHGASRASAALAMATGRYIRREGAAAPVSQGAGIMPVALLTGLAALAPLGAMLGSEAVAAALLGAIIGHVLMRRLYERRLGGYTGDCLGAVQQTTEVGLYVAVLAAI